MTGPLRVPHEMERKSREIARIVKDCLPDGVGFTLVLFDASEGGFTSYVSSADSLQTVNVLRELAVLIELEGAEPGCQSN